MKKEAQKGAKVKNHIYLNTKERKSKMLKYIAIPEYGYFHEIQFLSHIYQAMQQGKKEPQTILVHAYECDTKIFKGYVFNETKTYKSVQLLENELRAIEDATGKAEQVDFLEFIKGTLLEEYYKYFMESEEKQNENRKPCNPQQQGQQICHHRHSETH